MTRKTSEHPALVGNRAGFQRALGGWYRLNRRRLPWRETPSLYGTVVSEFMLQQTQVKTVLPYFERWMSVFPSFKALARATESEVLRQWEGLGYYSRARNLHRLARAVAALTTPPATAAAWRELPGVGPYTAAAVASIALGEPVACVDGNVVRILARLTADGREFRDSASASKAFADLADALVPRKAPGDHNQAMMELGATVCLKHNPACPACPVRSFCAGSRQGEPASYPRLARKVIEKKSVVRVWCEWDGKLLLHRAPPGSRRLADLHELPNAEHMGMEREAVSEGELIARKARGITRFIITESIHRTAAPLGTLPANLTWVPFGKLGLVTLSGPHRRWVTEILAKAKS